MSGTRRSHPAAGRKRSGRNGIETGIIFDDETFAEIRARAVREGTTFSEQVRMLCQWGLDDAAEDAVRHRATPAKS